MVLSVGCVNVSHTSWNKVMLFRKATNPVFPWLTTACPRLLTLSFTDVCTGENSYLLVWEKLIRETVINWLFTRWVPQWQSDPCLHHWREEERWLFLCVDGIWRKWVAVCLYLKFLRKRWSVIGKISPVLKGAAFQVDNVTRCFFSDYLHCLTIREKIGLGTG